MCLGVPARVIKINGDIATVDYGGIMKDVDAFLVPNLKVGDYVIVHAGAIIAKINEKEAMEMMKAWSSIMEELKGEI
ncbi:MAG: HypC/HybG/HupF family hydrogenase formation chaperone [Thermoprotei archaeon]|nr:HypC/HybG/HupF family hydrogenase formation chaperone [Thermoprotei archaeon]